MTFSFSFPPTSLPWESTARALLPGFTAELRHDERVVDVHLDCDGHGIVVIAHTLASTPGAGAYVVASIIAAAWPATLAALGVTLTVCVAGIDHQASAVLMDQLGGRGVDEAAWLERCEIVDLLAR